MGEVCGENHPAVLALRVVASCTYKKTFRMEHGISHARFDPETPQPVENFSSKGCYASCLIVLSNRCVQRIVPCDALTNKKA